MNVEADASLNDALLPVKAAVLSCWQERLTAEGAAASRAYEHVVQEISSGRDLFSIMLRSLGNARSLASEDRRFVRQKVQRPDYSIGDFHTEASTLEAAMDEALAGAERLDSEARSRLAAQARRWLRGVFHEVLGETAAFYEYVAESGGQSLCRMDATGEILYANCEMKRLLESDDPLGRPLHAFFADSDADFLRHAAASDKVEGRELSRRLKDGRRVFVSAEIRPLFVDDGRVGSYASFTDITKILEREMRFLDRSPLAVLRINTENRITYANPVAQRLLQEQQCEGRHLDEILYAEQDKHYVNNQIGLRRQLRGSEYSLNLKPLSGPMRKIPVAIAGVPITDVNGAWAGSIGIFRDLTLERAVSSMRGCIETSTNYLEMLDSVAGEACRMLDSDLFIVTRFSSDLRHGWPFYAYSPQGTIPFEKRWYALSPDMIRWIEQREIVVEGDYKAFIARPEWRALENDAAVRWFIDTGMASFLKIPVFSDRARLIATVVLFSKKRDAYSDRHKADASALPLREAVISALHAMEREELQFRYDILKGVATSESLVGIARLLTRKLGAHYRWRHTSIFHVDDGASEFKLVSQYCPNPEDRLRDDYAQPLDKGVLSQVLKRARDADDRHGILINDVRAESEFRDTHIDALGHTRSELCLPVFWDGDARWIFNVEDGQENAFTDEERDDLVPILQEIGGLLDQTVWLYRLNAGFDSSLTGIAVTDADDNLIRLNPTLMELLNYDSEETLPERMESLFSDGYEGKSLIHMHTLNRRETTMRRRDGANVDVLLTKFELAEELLGKVYTVEDLRATRRLEELQLRNDALYEIAVQMQTPLSLTFMWLERLARGEVESSDGPGLATRALRQLFRIQGTLDRLALLEEKAHLPTEALELNLATELTRVLNTLPQSDQDAVQREGAQRAYVRGDPYQISFVLQTILAYLLRFRPHSRPVSVCVRDEDGWVRLDFTGALPPPPQPDQPREQFIARTHAEMALGEPVIRTFVETNHHGKYWTQRRPDHTATFSVSFPAARRNRQ